MINMLTNAAQFVAAKSTIPPDQKDLGAGTVASVVITGIVVVFIGLILLILLVSIYGKIFDGINKRAAKKAEEAKKLPKLQRLPRSRPNLSRLPHLSLRTVSRKRPLPLLWPLSPQ